MKWLIKDNEGVFEILYRTDSKSKPRGVECFFCEGPDIKKEHAKIVLIDSIVCVVNDDTKETISNAYVEMDNSITNDAALVFKTTNIESMLAFVDSFQLRIIAPHKYMGMGLKAEMSIGVFVLGDALDTEQKIKDYYIEVLVDLDTKRNNKIKDFILLKSSAE